LRNAESERARALLDEASATAGELGMTRLIEKIGRIAPERAAAGSWDDSAIRIPHSALKFTSH